MESTAVAEDRESRSTDVDGDGSKRPSVIIEGPTPPWGPLPDPTNEAATRTPIRLGPGEFLVSLDAAEMAGWRYYLGALARLVPDLLPSLLTDEARKLVAGFHARDEGATSALNEHIRAWCDRWGLFYRWAHATAHNTLVEAARCVEEGRPVPTTLIDFGIAYTTSYRRERTAASSRVQPLPPLIGPLPRTASYEQSGAAVHVRTMMDPEAWETLWWNPWEETAAEAHSRIMTILDADVRRALEEIAAAVAKTGATRTPIKRTAGHFAWLVRFQVLGESYAAIADSAYRSRQAVKVAIQEAAALIGLPLRPPDPPGRPRKPKTPRIVKNRIVPQKHVN